MIKLIKGIHQFTNETFLSQKDLFERLSKGQNPDALFITCSDSRINPNLITHTEPGDLFIVRNAGNIVPPYSPMVSGETATIEFAVSELKVQDIIVCGHTLCGAMKGLLAPKGKLDHLPALNRWLELAATTKKLIEDIYAKEVDDFDTLVNIATQENVLVQLENLRTHPYVASALMQGKVKLHAWIYKIQTGEVYAYDPESGQFNPLTDLSAPISSASRFRLSESASI